MGKNFILIQICTQTLKLSHPQQAALAVLLCLVDAQGPPAPLALRWVAENRTLYEVEGKEKEQAICSLITLHMHNVNRQNRKIYIDIYITWE